MRAFFWHGTKNINENPTFCLSMLQPRQLSPYTDPLRARQSADRISVRVRFSAPVQTCTGAHSLKYNGHQVSFPGVKRPERGVNHPPNLASRFKKRVLQCLVENILFYSNSFNFIYFMYVVSILRTAGCTSQLNEQEVQITYHSHSNSKQVKLQKAVTT